MKRILIAVATAAAALVTAGVAGADQSYTDPAGDAGVGTDITTVSVRNDTGGGISIQVASASPIVGNHAVAIFIDADRNQSTGGQGDEYWMYGGPQTGVGFLAWNGSTFAPTNPASFSVGAAASNVTEFRIGRADLGNVAGFNFVAISISLDGDNLNFWDAAPDSGYFSYDLSLPQCSNGKDDDGDGKIDAQDLGCSSPNDDNESDDPVHVKLGAAKTTPLHPKAGGKAIVSAAATRVETSQPLDSGSVACSGNIVSGAALRGAGSLASGHAQCTFKIPKTAKGKTVRGKITVTYQTAPPATTSFAFKTAAK